MGAPPLQVLRGLPFCYGYIDDLLTASAIEDEHIEHLRAILQCLSDHGILVNLSKSVFDLSSLDFLGYHVNVSSIQPMESKVQAV